MTQRHGSLNGVPGLVVGLVALASFYLAAHIGSPPDPASVQARAAHEFSDVAHQSLVHRRGVGGAKLPANSSKLDATTLYATTIRKPAGPPQVFTGLTDPHGNAVTVSCSTCHATRQPNKDTKTVADLNEFHGSLQIAHGKISCLSCHNANDYDSLKLADGSRVEFTEVMSLCGQCHGPQMRDYEHNVHGGMNGYWDLTKGPRQKNNCVDCHNPHSPQFPKMQPTFKPRDRFLDPHRNE